MTASSARVARAAGDIAGRARWLQAATLGALAVFSVVPLAAMLRHAASSGLVFAGADGPFPADQFQYGSWIRQYGSHLLASNAFDTAPSDHVFLQPMFLLSGLLSRAGLSVEDAYLLWKPVAVIVVFLGFRAYVARFLTDTPSRLAALVIALFFVSPAIAIFSGAASMPGPSILLWGYLPATLSVGLMPLFLLGAERLVRSAPRARDVAVVTACGVAASWLHPWQGEVLLVTAGAAVLLDTDRWRLARRLLVPGLGLVAPLLYYFVLSQADASWSFAQEENARGGRIAAWAIAVSLVPLVVPALAGWRDGSWGDLQERMLRLWPLAVIPVYLLLSPSFPQHAFEGISLPLAVLAVRGLRRARPRVAWLAAAAAILVVPGTIHAARLMRDTVNAGAQPFYLQPGEDRALAYLSSVKERGAVLSAPYLGSLVPARTGRATWVGHPSWTPGFPARAAEAEALFSGRLGGSRAQALVRSARVSLVLDDCAHRGAALQALKPIVVSVRRFGCASVYRVSTG
jgi:hypothetical protein